MNVLILSDFSEVAINATHYAMDMLQNERVKFSLLNIYENKPDITEEDYEERRLATLEKLRERVEILQEESKGRDHKFTGHYSEDNLVTAARKFVAQRSIDLIVMGSVGKKFQHSTILGDHTFEIISKVKCNILAVAEGSKFTSVERMVIPVDYSAAFKKKNFSFLKKWKIFRNTRLDVYEIANPVMAVAPVEVKKGQKNLFGNLTNITTSFSQLSEDHIYDQNLLSKMQLKFDLIVLLGKNIQLCERLLHNRRGLYTEVPNRLPILVLHD